MLIPERRIVEGLRRAGYVEAAEEVEQSLPDPVELERAAEFGMRYGGGVALADETLRVILMSQWGSPDAVGRGN
jgi:hypothetical protein